MDDILRLKPDVAEKYKVKKDFPIHGFTPKFGEINLSEQPLESCDQLYDAGFEGLELKVKKPAKTT